MAQEQEETAATTRERRESWEEAFQERERSSTSARKEKLCKGLVRFRDLIRSTLDSNWEEELSDGWEESRIRGERSMPYTPTRRQMMENDRLREENERLRAELERERAWAREISQMANAGSDVQSVTSVYARAREAEEERRRYQEQLQEELKRRRDAEIEAETLRSRLSEAEKLNREETPSSALQSQPPPRHSPGLQANARSLPRWSTSSPLPPQSFRRQPPPQDGNHVSSPPSKFRPDNT